VGSFTRPVEESLEGTSNVFQATDVYPSGLLTDYNKDVNIFKLRIRSLAIIHGSKPNGDPVSKYKFINKTMFTSSSFKGFSLGTSYPQDNILMLFLVKNSNDGFQKFIPSFYQDSEFKEINHDLRTNLGIIIPKSEKYSRLIIFTQGEIIGDSLIKV
jgi:hypothetical protein